MPRTLKNGWTVYDVNGIDGEFYWMDLSLRQGHRVTRQSHQINFPGAVLIDHFGSYADEIPISELETMDNLVRFQNDAGFWVRWDGVEYGPFDTLGAPHVIRIDGVIMVGGSREEVVAGKLQRAFYNIAEGKMRGPFTHAFTPRFERGYFAEEPRFDGHYLVWGDIVLGPYPLISCARLTQTNARVFQACDRLPCGGEVRWFDILDTSVAA